MDAIRHSAKNLSILEPFRYERNCECGPIQGKSGPPKLQPRALILASNLIHQDSILFLCGMSKMNLWWGPPKNFSERAKERKVSWLELFYDLAYVAVIAQLTQQLAMQPSWTTVGRVFLLFALVFWSWVNGSQYYDLHGSDSIRTRVFTFLQMIAISAVAIAIPGVFEGHHRPFAIAFLIIQGLITYLWWSVGLYDRSHRVLNLPYLINYLLGFAFLSFSLFTGPAFARGLWVAATAFNITP